MNKAKPSFTAFLIPKVLPALAANKKYANLVTRQQVNISRRFARECAKNDFGIKLLHNLIGKRAAMWLADNIAIKGLPVHYAARKNYIRSKLEAVAAEVKQVVVIGAGFDTLALEYAQKYPAMKFFEIDQYATQKIKLDALKKMPGIATANINFIDADLSKRSLQETLLQNDFDKNAKSFFVIEGVLPYLETKDVKKLFGDIAGLSGAGSYAVFGSMSELKVTGDKRAKFSDAALTARKEKYKFAASPDAIEALVSKAGFKLLESRPYHELQRGIADERQLEALKKERGEHYYFAVKA